MKAMHPDADVSKRINGTACVFVACKLPNGLICAVAEGTEKYQWVRLRGQRASAHKLAGITQVPTDFWNAWLKAHAWMDCVKDGLLKAYPTMEHAVASTFANAKQPTGFEPLKGPPVPSSGEGEPGTVTTDAEHLARLGLSGLKLSA